MKPSLALDDQLCFALYAASRAMTQAYRPALEALGLTYPQYLVLLVLWEGDDITLKELGARLMLDSGTLTPLVRRLEGRGWLLRARDAEDERRTRIRLTAAGRALRERAYSVPESLLCHVSDAAELEAIAALRDRIADLTARLRAPTGPRPTERGATTSSPRSGEER